MKRSFWALIILLVIAVLAYFTKPDKEAHQKALSEVVPAAGVNDVMLSLALDYCYSMNIIELKDYMVCTVSVVPSKSSDKVISVGVFGKVFVINKNLQ